MKVLFLLSCGFILLSCTGKGQEGKTADGANSGLETGNSINQRDSLAAEELIAKDSLLADTLQPAECIFTIQSGRVVPNPNMIDTLFQSNKKAPEVLVYEEKVQSRDRSSEYQVSLYTYEQYLSDNEPGLFSVINIRKGDKELLRLGQGEVWDTIPTYVTKKAPMYFMTVHLSDKMTALLFQGYCYGTGPTPFSIIVLNGDKATWVYNKENIYLMRATNNANGFTAYVSLSYDEPYGTEEEPKMSYSMKLRIWLEDGVLKIKELGRIDEELFE